MHTQSQIVKYGINVTNLLRMKEYLEGDKLTFGFHMRHFIYDELIDDTKLGCGTVGCVVGHALYRFMDVDQYRNEYDGHRWDDVSKDFFGIEGNTHLWDYLFSSDWHYVDNTPSGAAQRIQNVVDAVLMSKDEQEFGAWTVNQYREFLQTMKEQDDE